jgi:hypothetical protein
LTLDAWSSHGGQVGFFLVLSIPRSLIVFRHQLLLYNAMLF